MADRRSLYKLDRRNLMRRIVLIIMLDSPIFWRQKMGVVNEKTLKIYY